MTSCDCEGCRFLDTRLGHTLLDYAIGFIKEVADTVRAGKAEVDDELIVEFHGPDASGSHPLSPGRGHKVLASYRGTVGEVARMRRLPIAQRPDIDVLRGVYENDPVVQKLLDWVEAKHNV